MKRRTRIDAAGVAMLVGFALLMASNQVVIKVAKDGLQPVFMAGLRSVGAVGLLYLWIRARGGTVALPRGVRGLAFVSGLVFAFEFVCLFTALDLTTVTRSSIVFYSMPVWLTLGAHLMLPGERLTPLRGLGLALAFAGVAWALAAQGGSGGGASGGRLAGEVLALAAALGWAALALLSRATRLRDLSPEVQSFWQLAISAPVLLALAPLFGPLLRDVTTLTLAGLTFQIVVIGVGGFAGWYWLLSVYPASGVASFSFLSPVFGVLLGWALLGEQAGAEALVALVLVAAGLVLVNRAPPRAVGAT